MAANTNYDTYTKDLLKKAGLWKEGTIQVRQFVSPKQKQLFNRQNSGVLVQYESDEAVLDRRDMDERLICVPDATGRRIAGYWANGLTKEEVEHLSITCNLPFYYLNAPADAQGNSQPDTCFHVRHLKEYDLADPAQCAEFNVLFHNAAIALDSDKIFGDTTMYWHRIEDERKQRVAKVQYAQQALELVMGAKAITSEVKQEVVELMGYIYRLPLTAGMNIDDYNIVAFEFAKDFPKRFMDTYELKNRRGRLLLYRLINSGKVIKYDEDGNFHRTPQSGIGANISMGATWEDAVESLYKPENRLLREEAETGIVKSKSKVAQIRERQDNEFLDGLNRTDTDVPIELIEVPEELCKTKAEIGKLNHAQMKAWIHSLIAGVEMKDLGESWEGYTYVQLRNWLYAHLKFK